MTATWDRSWIRLAIVAAVTVKVVGLVLVVDWTGRATNPFDLAKSLYSRTLEWILIALLIVALIVWGKAILPRTRLHLLIAAIVVANALALLFSAQPYLAFFGTQGRYLGFVFVIDMAVLYLTVAIAFRSRQDWLILFGGLAASVCVSLAYAWLQHAGLDPLPWSMTSRERPFSTIGNPNTYGHLLSVALPASAALAVIYRGSHRWVIRIFATALAVVIVLVDGVVATRGTLLGLAAAGAVVPIVYLKVRGVSRANAFRAGIAGAAAFMFVIFAIAPSPLSTRIGTVLSIAANQDRIQVWVAAASAFLARPFLGFGPDSLLVAWPTFRPLASAAVQGPGTLADSAHDWILQTAATTGIIGLAASVAALIAFSFTIVRRGFARDVVVAGTVVAAMAGYWAHALVSVGTIGVDWVPWVAYGAGATFFSDSIPTARRRIPAIVVLLAVFIALGAGALGTRTLEANRDSWRAREAIDINQAQQAIGLAREAVTLDSGRADYWNELGRAYFAASRWADAADAFESASSRAPWIATYESNRARALAQIARAANASFVGADAAIAAARRGTQIDPKDPLPYIALAQVASGLDRADIALAAAVDAFVLYQDPTYETSVVSSSSRVLDLAAAREQLERAISARDSAKLRVALGNIALRQGDRDTARASAQRALALEPNNPDALALMRAAGG
ncbi:MAG: tetratricopeptide repeat protein [Betaproteobacteria bacterium]|nr:MAG: tetratricopeptide repeat protein [Betaproteobacteria bacterium]